MQEKEKGQDASHLEQVSTHSDSGSKDSHNAVDAGENKVCQTAPMRLVPEC